MKGQVVTCSVRQEERLPCHDIPLDEDLVEACGIRPFARIGEVTLFRSRSLDKAGDQEITKLRYLQITEVFDLRKRKERLESGLWQSAGINLHCLKGDLQGDSLNTISTRADNIELAYGSPGERMVNMYMMMAHQGALIQEVLASLLPVKHNALVLCEFGKDRTGVICACLQRILGCSLAEIEKGYLETNTLNERINARDIAVLKQQKNPREIEIMQAMFEARSEYLDAFWTEIDACYGSFDAFQEGIIRRQEFMYSA